MYITRDTLVGRIAVIYIALFVSMIMLQTVLLVAVKLGR